LRKVQKENRQEIEIKSYKFFVFFLKNCSRVARVTVNQPKNFIYGKFNNIFFIFRRLKSNKDGRCKFILLF